MASLPANVGRLQGSREERGVIGANKSVAAVDVAELELTDNLGHNGLQLRVGEVLADAAMTTGTEGQVGRSGALADKAVSVVDLLLLLGVVAGNGRGVRRTGLPSVRVPLIGVGEVGRVGSADTGSGQESVRGRDNILGSGNRHGGLDGAHDRVDRGVEAESLLDDGLVERELGKILKLQRGEVGTESLDLLLVELLHNVGVLGETEHDPRAGGRGRVLAGHEEGNHHMGDLVVGDGGAVLVGRVHEMLHHVVLGVIVVLVAALLDGVHVDLGDGSLSVVTLAVPGERSPVKHEVDGGEAHIKVVVESGEGLVKLAADDAALEGVGGGEDGDLGHLLGDIDNAGLALEVGALLEVVAHLARDDGDVGSEGLGGKSDLHELS